MTDLREGQGVWGLAGLNRGTGVTVRCEDGSSWKMGFTLGWSEPVMMELPPRLIRHSIQQIYSWRGSWQRRPLWCHTPQKRSYRDEKSTLQLKIHASRLVFICYCSSRFQLLSPSGCAALSFPVPVQKRAWKHLEASQAARHSGTLMQWKLLYLWFPVGRQRLLLSALSEFVCLSVWFDFVESHE